MPLAKFMGAGPTRKLTWTVVTDVGGLPSDLYGKSGLYAIHKGDSLLYIGQTENLSRRLGQAVGAICGGGDLHPGGYRIYQQWDHLPAGELWFEVFEGDWAYDKEAEAIFNLSPPLNKRGQRK